MYRSRRGGTLSGWCLVAIKDLGVGRVPRSRKWLEGAFLCVLEESILVDNLFLNWRVRRRNGLGRALGQPRLALHPLDQIRKGDPSLGVDVEDPSQDGIALISDGKDGLEEVRVLPVGLVRGVLNRCTLPRVATACQVDENHAQGPHVVGRRRVASHRVRVCILAFCCIVSLIVCHECVAGDTYQATCKMSSHIQSRRSGHHGWQVQSRQA
jgi:hypothetical protein